LESFSGEVANRKGGSHSFKFIIKNAANFFCFVTLSAELVTLSAVEVRRVSRQTKKDFHCYPYRGSRRERN
jgi:hypothetical protein